MYYLETEHGELIRKDIPNLKECLNIGRELAQPYVVKEHHTHRRILSYGT